MPPFSRGKKILLVGGFFLVRYSPNRTIEYCKARVVAKYFTCVINYHEIFSSIANLHSIKKKKF